MLELPHTLVGAAIATKVPNPLVSLPLAFLSHFAIDLIPHWNPSLYLETKKHGHPNTKSTWLVVVDVLLSLGAGFFIASRALPNFSHSLTIILACFAAVFVDVIEGPYFFLGFRPQWLKKLIRFQRRHQGRAKIIHGLVTQVVTIFLTLLIILS